MPEKTDAMKVRDAIIRGELENVVAFLGSDKNRLEMMTPFGSFLHVAAAHGKLDIVKRLVELGADVNAYGGITRSGSLNQAASRGYLEIVRYLLSCGAKLDVSSPEKNPLFSAIHGGHMDIVKLLMDSGIDAEIKYSGASMKNMDAVEFAKERGQIDIARFLAERWFAAPGALDEGRRFAIEMRTAIMQGDSAKLLTLLGTDNARLATMTPLGGWLHIAAAHGQLEISKRLVSLGADVNRIGGVLRGGPLNEAAWIGHLDGVQFLLTCGAEMDVTEPLRNPLFSAIRGGHMEVAKLLLGRGIDIHLKYIGRTALSFAKECGQTEIAKLLEQPSHPVNDTPVGPGHSPDS